LDDARDEQDCVGHADGFSTHIVGSKRDHDSMSLSNRTIAALAQPFEGGGGPSHSTIQLIWTSAGAADYLGDGNKLDRVLGGLRALRDGRRPAPGQQALPPDHDKLRSVASGLATRLVASGVLDPDKIEEALQDEHPSTQAASTRSAEKAGTSPDVDRRTPDTLGSGRTSAAALRNEPVVDDPRVVMVVHGQDTEAARSMFDWLRAIGLRPREWSQHVKASGEASPFIGRVLETAFTQAQAVVVLFTPDEHALLRSDLGHAANKWRLQSRPNVLFEAGMAFAAHPDRSVLVVLGDQELPSDLAGRHYVRLGPVQALRDLAERLEQAGCPVDLSGGDRLDVGRFPDRSGIDATPA
jgi:predicted nucleotide-binding protein